MPANAFSNAVTRTPAFVNTVFFIVWASQHRQTPVFDLLSRFLEILQKL